MASITYSSGALNVLSKFHRTDLVVYVEGPDDQLFWRIVLNRHGMRNFEIKEAGGVRQLEKYCRDVLTDDARIAVARDRDYTDILGPGFDHPRILLTYGYSLENSLYCPKSISFAIALIARSNDEYEGEVIDWLEHFARCFRPLVVYDVANERLQKGIKVLGESCIRFLKTSRSCQPCVDKIDQHLAALSLQFTPDEVAEAQDLLAETAKDTIFLIRGHFLTVAVVNYIKYRVKHYRNKDVQMSNEHLYDVMLGQLRDRCENPCREDYQYYRSKVQELIDSLSKPA